MRSAGRRYCDPLANEAAVRYKEIESVGGVAYLASLTEGLPMRPVIEDYIRIVKDKSLLRRLMAICSAAIARAADQSETALEVLDMAEGQLLESGKREGHSAGGLQPLDQIVQESFGSIDNLYKQAREVTGLATHFVVLDQMTSGLQKGELIILAARPSMGKTALAMNIAQQAAVQGKATVAVFSLEMSKESLLRRMLSAQSGVDQRKLQTGFLGREDHGEELAARAGSSWSEAQMYIDSNTAGRASRWRRCGPSRGGSGRMRAGWI